MMLINELEDELNLKTKDPRKHLNMLEAASLIERDWDRIRLTTQMYCLSGQLAKSMSGFGDLPATEP
jgi:predicted transcriptional regulator